MTDVIWANIKGNWKPATAPRLITRGRNKNRVEVTVRIGTSKGIRPRRRIVDQAALKARAGQRLPAFPF